MQISKRYNEVMKNNPPRLVIRYKIEDGREDFEWGTNGAMPVLDLVASIVHVQNRLTERKPHWMIRNVEDRMISQQELVLTFDITDRSFDWFIGENIPFGPMAGYLELVKMTMLGTTLARRMAAQQLVLGN